MSDSDIDLVRARRAEIAKLRKELDAEDAELDITERTLARLAAADRPASNGHAKQSRIILRRSGTSVKPSQKDMIVGTLKAEPIAWITDAGALQAKIKEIHGVELPMTTIYPYLSSLKSDGIIVRGKSGEIALADRIKKTA